MTHLLDEHVGRVSRPDASSHPTYGWVIALLVVVAVILETWLRSMDLASCRRQAETMLAETIAANFRSAPSMNEAELQRRCERLCDHPAIIAAALWGQSGTSLASAGAASALVALARPRGTTSALSINAIDPPPTLSNNLPRLDHVEVSLGDHSQPRRPDHLCMLVAPQLLLSQPGGHGAFFLFGISATGALAYLALRRTWRHRVARPLQELLRLTTSPDAGAPPSALIACRHEWAAIGQCIVDLRSEAAAWHDNARSAEHRVGRHVAHATQHIARHLKLMERESFRDPLTGLANRRLLNEKLPDLFAVHQSRGEDLAAVMFDLDHFKELNDAAGHAAGDAILAFAGELLAQCARPCDLAVRYGGDEFLLVLPGMSTSDALSLAQRVIALFAQRVKAMGPRFSTVSMTAGAASFLHHHPAGAGELVVMADTALYDGKRSGKKGARAYAPAMLKLAQ